MSKKRNKSKKLHQRRRKVRSHGEARLQREQPAERAFRLRPPPSAFDQMSVFIDERALGMPQTRLADLRAAGVADHVWTLHEIAGLLD